MFVCNEIVAESDKVNRPRQRKTKKMGHCCPICFHILIWTLLVIHPDECSVFVELQLDVGTGEVCLHILGD